MNLFALVDCNNFYVSCERVFNPRLEGHPVIVLSNNDGCVVARSQEARQLGIGMGEPFFKIKELCSKKGVIVYSSNYELYGNLSGRVMAILAAVAPDLQVYSIDEAFLWFSSSNTSEEVVAQCKNIRSRIKQWIGIPTSIGIAPSKTLAKIATKLAKKSVAGVVDLSSVGFQEEVLKGFPIGEVWGIGARSEATVHALGIQTAWDFCKQNPSFIRRHMGIVGERMLWELRGMSCLPLQEEQQANKTVTCSRSFGRCVCNQESLAEALSTHVASACEKLREQQVCARAMYVYIMALVNSSTGERSCSGTTASFSVPTNCTPDMIHRAKECLSHLFCEGQRYKKCGVVMLDLVSEKSICPDLFLDCVPTKRRKILNTVDAINARFGRHSLFYGAMGIDQGWASRSDNHSRRYTTRWDELAIVQA